LSPFGAVLGASGWICCAEREPRSVRKRMETIDRRMVRLYASLHMKNRLNGPLVVGALLVLGVGVALQFWGVSAVAGVVLRWVACAGLLVYAWRARSLTPWFFVMMVIGTELGFDAPKVANQLAVFPDIFLRLIKTIVAPLVLSMLVVGIAGHGDLKGVGRMGLKALVYFEVVTTAALVIGLVAIDISKAGVGLGISFSQTVQNAPPPTHWNDFLLHVFPENLAKSIAEGQILQVVVFAVLFGCALAMVSEAKRAPVLRLAEGISEAMLKFTNIVMYFAPLAVGAAMAYTVGHLGMGVLLNLGKLLVTLYVALVVFAVCVMLPAALLFRVPVRGFLKAVAEPATIAFATGASEAALPSAMECMESFGVPRRVVAFVIPAGYSFNLDGSTLYLAIASMFVAQAGGVHMTVGQQVVMLLTLIVASKGIAGVPKSVMVVLLATAATFHLPEGPIMVLLASDALLDMARTVINVTGNCLASVIVARWEGVFGVKETVVSVEERVMAIEG
jgi:proton glutamate symport protein